MRGVDQKDYQAVKQPKTLTWGFRNCNAGDMESTEVESVLVVEEYKLIKAKATRLHKLFWKNYDPRWQLNRLPNAGMAI